MSRSVTFNGITQFRPGGLTKVDASALAQVGLSTNGIVGLIGESSGGGQPGEIITIDDPALAKPSFRGGALANAIRTVFDPSDDPRVPSGAFRTLNIRVNQGTRSSLTLYNKVATVTVASVAGGTVITVDETLTADQYNGCILRKGTYAAGAWSNYEDRDISDTATDSVTIASAFSADPVDDDVLTVLTPVVTLYSKEYSSQANGITQEYEPGASFGQAWTTAFEGVSQVSDDLGGKSFLDLEYIGQNQEVIQVSGVADGAGSTTVLADAGAFTAAANAGQFILAGIGKSGTGDSFAFASPTVTLTDAAAPFKASDDGKTITIAGATTEANNGTFTITYVSATEVSWSNASGVAEAFPGTWSLASTGTLDIPNLRKIDTNTADDLTVDNAFENSSDVATAPGVDTDYRVKTGKIHSGTLPAQTNATSSTCYLEATIDIYANELADLVMVITSGTGVGQVRAIASNTSKAGAVGAIVTIDEPWITQPAVGDTYEIRYVTTALATIAGSAGLAKTLTTSIATNGGSAATDLNITFNENQTLQELVDEINANSNYSATVPGGINAQTTLVKTFDFDLGAYEVDIRNDRNAVVDPPNRTYDIPVPWPNHFRADLQLLVNDINSKNEFATAVRSVGAMTGAGSGRPEFTDGSVGVVGDSFKYFTGGTRGSSTNSNWQAAFDKLLQVRCNHVVPLICQDLANEGYSSTATFDSVCAQLAAHVSLCSGAAKNECGGYIGMKDTKTNIAAKANSLNNADVQLTCQRHTLLDVDGNLTEFDEWVSAVIAAGMRSGVAEVGEPLTWKYFRTYGMDQDSSWDPLDKTDANYFIQNGILFAETISGKGTRWVRDLTTYVQDDNLAYAEGSVRDVVRYTAYGLRTFLEDRFTGVKASPATAAGIKSAAAAYLETLRSESIIVDSEDDQGNPVYAYHNIRVSISGDIASIKVEVFPAVGINFQLTEIYLQLPQSSA